MNDEQIIDTFRRLGLETDQQRHHFLFELHYEVDPSPQIALETRLSNASEPPAGTDR